MAADASSLWETLAGSFLTCNICLGHYCQPKILPCLHSYCQDCLKTLQGGAKRELRCPECREPVPLPAGIEGLKTNFFINGLLDLVPPVEKARVTCSLCPLIGQDASSVAVSHCIDCADHLCQACASGHRCSRLTHKHLVVDMEAYHSGKYNEEIRKRQAARCKEHKGENLQYFCIPCAAALCRECRLGHHLEHPCLSLSEAAKARRPVITGLLAGVAEKVQLIARGKASLEEEIKEMEVWNTNIRSVVEQTCAKAVEQLLSHKGQVLAQLSSYLEERKVASRLLLSELGFQEQVASSTVAFAQKVLSLGQEEEIVSLEQMISERLRQLQGFSWEALAVQVPKLRIQPNLLCGCNLFHLEFHEKPTAAAPEGYAQVARKKAKQKPPQGAEVGEACRQEQAPSGGSSGLLESGGPPSPNGPEVPRLTPKPVFFCSFWVKVPTDKKQPQITGLCPFGSGEILLADEQNKKLKRFSVQGEFKGTIPVPGDVAPFSVAAVGNKVVFTAASQLYVLNETGGIVWQKALKGGQASHAVTTCDGNCVVVSVAGHLEVFNMKGQLLERIVPEGSHDRSLVFLGRWKEGFVASDWYRRSVVLLGRKGDLVTEYQEEQLKESQPGSVCADAPGIIYVVLRELNKVVAFSEAGEVLGSFLTTENNIFKPRMVTIAGDGHFVAALTNGTVHVFKIKYQGK
ncbi:PREDICTED: E3 ubiquitin-protein ligase TRIM56 [Thamnophis sirtalis]|uniref:RING-type E3 ubiquitin transferase n=1 Tax=Thamnophis sirtalis TaxID=35019 RepID=A0A6I9YN94_9SAUR|nr:PREDICTED: E3 ubiquitin-protein ligase TRIM56 [Thamnophis sirtalis]